MQVFVLYPIFNYLGHMPRYRNSQSYGNSIFNVLRESQNVLHCGCIILPPFPVSSVFPILNVIYIFEHFEIHLVGMK